MIKIWSIDERRMLEVPFYNVTDAIQHIENSPASCSDSFTFWDENDRCHGFYSFEKGFVDQNTFCDWVNDFHEEDLDENNFYM